MKTEKTNDECPFGIGTNEKYEYIIKLGNQLASGKTFKSPEEARAYIDTKPWELIGILAMGMAHAFQIKLEEAKEESKLTELKNQGKCQ